MNKVKLIVGTYHMLLNMFVKFCDFITLKDNTPMLKGMFVVLSILFPIGVILVSLILITINLLGIILGSVPTDTIVLLEIIKYALLYILLFVIVAVVFGKNDTKFGKMTQTKKR